MKLMCLFGTWSKCRQEYWAIFILPILFWFDDVCWVFFCFPNLIPWGTHLTFIKGFSWILSGLSKFSEMPQNAPLNCLFSWPIKASCHLMQRISKNLEKEKWGRSKILKVILGGVHSIPLLHLLLSWCTWFYAGIQCKFFVHIGIVYMVKHGEMSFIEGLLKWRGVKGIRWRCR